MNAIELCAAIEDSFHKVFPNSRCNARFKTNLGAHITVGIALSGSNDELANKILQNDPMYQVIIVDGFTRDGECLSKLTVEGGSGFDIKSSNPALYCERVKLFRKFSVDTPEKVVAKFDALFLKYQNALIEHVEGVQAIVQFNVRTKLV